MSRKKFIERQGATCSNWNWSWSFVNHAKRFVIFGLWDTNMESDRGLIFSNDWRVDRKGKKPKGFEQSREHLRLIEELGYRLFTFTQKYGDGEVNVDGISMPKIESFEEVLSEKSLHSEGDSWFVFDGSIPPRFSEEADSDLYREGAQTKISINKYERDPAARRDCLAHYGYECCVCGFDFEKAYGSRGAEFVHVHHLIPLGAAKVERDIDPIKDLVPVCANCHAIIHRSKKPLSISAMKELLQVSYVYKVQ